MAALKSQLLITPRQHVLRSIGLAAEHQEEKANVFSKLVHSASKPDIMATSDKIRAR